MAEEFLSDSSNSPIQPNSPTNHKRDREPVRLIIVGSRRGITHLIHDLYTKDFAQVHEWSKPAPEPNSGEFISVTTKYIRLD